MRGAVVRRVSLVLCCAIALTSLGCLSSTSNSYQMGQQAAARKDWDMAVIYHTKALEEKPNDIERQIALDKSRMAASNMHFERAKQHLAVGNLEAAIVELQQSVNLNQANQFAFQELQKAVKKLQDQRSVETGEKTELEILKENAKQPIGSPPRLDPASDVEITIKFDEEPLSEILSALGAIYGINFLYDDTVRKENELTVDLTGVSFEEALELIMLQSGNAYTVISENTLMVYPDNRSKQQEWQDQVIKTFYLSNADVNDVNSLLRTLIESRRVSVNKQLNAISIRDTLDKIAIADQIIRANDKAKSEVVIDVDLYQVDRSLLQNLGIDLNQKSIAFSHDQATDGLRLNNLNPLADLGAWLLAPIPSVTIDFLREHSLSRALAQPRVRATEGERVSLHIGDQVPIPNTTFSSSQTVNGNIVPVTSFTYQNVGIQIQLEPRVHHNREVTLRLELEVSRITSVNSSGQPTIGTRQVNTVIRLRDGETNMLAGLFTEEDVKGLSTLPGVDEIPGVRRAFGSRDRNLRQTDILLTLTPHIIRIPDIAENDLRPLWVGTERNIRMRNKGALSGGYGQGPFGQQDPEDVYDIFKPTDNTLDESAIEDLLRENGMNDGDSQPLLGTGSSALPPIPPVAPSGAEPAASEPVAQPAASAAPSRPRTSPSHSAKAGVARNTNRPRTNSGSSGAAAVANRVVEVRFSPPSVQVAKDGTTRVELRAIAGGDEVASLPFYVFFDPTIVSLEAVEEGPFLSSTGRSVLFNANIQEDRAIVGAAAAGQGPGATGEGHLATLVFRGLRPGTSVIRLRNVSPVDSAGNSLRAEVTAATVTVR